MDIETYVGTFHENNRDTVVAQIIKSRLIKRAFETEAGRALFNSTIDEIAKKVEAILGSCTQTKSNQTEIITRNAQEVHVAYNLLRSWADILVQGKTHEEAMK